MAKVLILAGDAAEDLETMFVKYRLLEAGHEPYVAAPTTRPIKLVVHDFEPEWDTYVEKPGRTCPVDVAFADVDLEGGGHRVEPVSGVRDDGRGRPTCRSSGRRRYSRRWRPRGRPTWSVAACRPAT